MVDRVDMALDDIIKATKKGPRPGGGAGRKFEGNRKPGRGGGGGGGFRSARPAAGGGGVLRGRNRGGVSKPTNYTRVIQIVHDNDCKWRVLRIKMTSGMMLKLFT